MLTSFSRICTPSKMAAAVLMLVGASLVQAQGAPQSITPAADERFIWDLTPLFATPSHWEAERQSVLADLPKLSALKGSVANGDAQSLLKALQAQSALWMRLSRLGVYASTQQSTDNRNPQYQERGNLIRAVYGQARAAMAWLAPEIQSLGAAQLEAMLAKEPGLAPHAVNLRDTLRQARHTLSADTEAALGAMSPVSRAASQARTLLMNSDIRWPSVTIDGKSQEVNPTSYGSLREHPNRAVREQVFKAFYGQLAQFESSLGSLLSSRMQAGTIEAKLRQHKNAISANLFADQIPESVVRNLVTQAHAGLPVLHRYFKLRQRMLGLPDLHYHDIYPDLVKLDKPFSLEESVRLTTEATQVLGPQYQRHLKAGLTARSMHVFPAPGKSSGAYKTSVYRMTPYVFLNHQDTFNSASTVAHEWGHGVHSMLADEAQPPENAGYALFTAEVAAITNEVLLSEMVKAQAQTREEKLFYLGYALEQMRGTFFRQTMFAEFELAAHDALERGEALGGKKLTQIYCGLLRKYHGTEQGVMKIDPAYCTEWAYIPHFFTPFYVYQYATSMAAASYLGQGMLKGQEGLRDKYLGVLRAGGARPPYELLRDAGVDLASPEPYQALLSKMDATMDEIERLLAR